MKLSIALLLTIISMNVISAAAQNRKPVVNHIAVYVYNLHESTHFYKDIIGLGTIPEPFHDGKHTWLNIGDNAALHLIEGAHSITEHDKNSHICFSVTDLKSFMGMLDKNNIEYGNWAGQKQTFTLRPDGVKQIYFKDPDGYWIEVNDAK
jgi:lactoylglutathione lyase